VELAMSRILYLDTNILIYLLEDHENLSVKVAQILDDYTKTNDSALLTSAVAITEFLAGTVSSSLETLHKIPGLTFKDLDETLAEQAGTLQRQNNLQIGDAMHLATAISGGSEFLFTNDKQLAKVASKYIAIKGL
jgi:predicted nucleic acid-binding protein